MAWHKMVKLQGMYSFQRFQRFYLFNLIQPVLKSKFERFRLFPHEFVKHDFKTKMLLSFKFTKYRENEFIFPCIKTNN